MNKWKAYWTFQKVKQWIFWCFAIAFLGMLISSIVIGRIDKGNSAIRNNFDKAYFSQELHRLSPVKNQQEFEIVDKKYILYITCETAEDPVTAFEQKKSWVLFHAVDYTFEGQSADEGVVEAVISSWWDYLRLQTAIRHKLFKLFGQDVTEDLYFLGMRGTAANNVDYRYSFRMCVKKGDSIYYLQAVCKKPQYQNEMITEFVNEINARQV